MNPLDDAIALLRMAWAQGRPAVVAVNPGPDNFRIPHPMGMTPHDSVILSPNAYAAFVAPARQTPEGKDG